MQDNRVYLFDTTLRDGQQSPGAGMSFEDNLIYADLAQRVGIDILEAGFPAASQADFDVVYAIAERQAETAGNMTLAALCQLREAQCITTMQALQPCLATGTARLHTYVPVDPNLMQASLGGLAENQQQIIETLAHIVKLATDAGFEVEFSPEGYSQMGDNFDFVTDLIRAAIASGARIINCPDTIGGASPLQGADYFVVHMQQHAEIMTREFPGRDIIWSAHCHNDFGMALTNSINAVIQGPARQIEGCINGVGERAGNVALEQCMLYLKTFGAMACADEPYHTHTQFEQLQAISDFIAERMLPRQPHWPITGDNAARHSSGGHTNAILNNPLAYQPFDPCALGSEISFVFGPLSGSNHAKEIIERQGFRCAPEDKVAITQAIKDRYAHRRKGITDEELLQGYFAYYQPINIDKIERVDAHRYQLQGRFFNVDDPNWKADSHEAMIKCIRDAVSDHFPELATLEAHQLIHQHQQQWQAMAKCQEQQLVQIALAEDSMIALLQACFQVINQAYLEYHYRLEG